ncbi:MAG: NADH-quinone oxidoreductase subunit J [Ktedonobacteraceae bacterium]|nr:NADH-quinone oxidoreductase subunit J [Ktedonobacteraceae bacterium]MBO0795742.1 NADH-quinone oxidoreductase subunit J [Ktedonobacteraceae bacterium]
MDLASVLFWIFAAILVGAALMVVGMRNIVHSALALIVLFAMAAGIYLLLDAEFIAMVQILVYAGAVTILILFALMLTRIRGARYTNPTNRLWFIALVICALLGAAVIYAATVSPHLISNVSNGSSQLPAGVNNVARIGELLYSPDQYSYVLPFEIASVVLLVAIVGAIVIGRED